MLGCAAALLSAGHAFAQKPAPARRVLSANDQRPRPYFVRPERDRRLELLEIGPDLGIMAHPSDSDSITYSAGFAFGVHARIEILRWLGFRALLSRAIHGVSVPDGALLEGTRASQPSLSVLQLGARIEPTWSITPQTRAWFGIGAAWDRIWADRPDLSGRQVQAADRTGAAVEVIGALGATWDVIPKWLALSLCLSASGMVTQSGNMFERLQAIDEDVSRPNDPLVYIDGLPEFQGAASALFGVGLLL